jgi:hypothetical protein
MKPTAIFPLAVLLASTPVFGQVLNVTPPLDPAKCPLGLQVERSAGLFAYKNAKSDPASDAGARSAQWFEFNMTNYSPHQVIKAEITAHGFSYQKRMLPVSAPASDMAKTLHVALDIKGNSHGSRELSFAHFSSVTAIEVKSVTYADGSTWRAAAPGACSVAPSAFMRVSAQ